MEVGNGARLEAPGWQAEQDIKVTKVYGVRTVGSMQHVRSIKGADSGRTGDWVTVTGDGVEHMCRIYTLRRLTVIGCLASETPSASSAALTT